MVSASKGAILLGLLTIYLVWGSTYLAIRVAVETLPPFSMAGARFLLAGAIVAAILLMTGRFKANRGQWVRNAVIGFWMLVGGNGLVSWAEQEVPSGVATLIVSFNPLMMAVAEWLLWKRSDGKIGSRPTGRIFVGLGLGIVGLGMLVLPTLQPGAATSLDPLRVLALIVACLAWTIGSCLSRYGRDPVEPFTGAAIQMLCGGLWLCLLGLFLGEAVPSQWASVSTRSVLAWFYLVVAGSLIAFTTFAWLMKHASPTLVSTYAYVNPIVAVFLGCLLLGETFDSRMLTASLTIVAGVALITLSKAKRLPPK